MVILGGKCYNIYMRFIRGVFVTIITILVVFVAPFSTYAISEAQLNFYGQNGIYYYDPDGYSCGEMALGSFDGSATAGLSDLQAGFVDTYYAIAQKLSVAYGIPWETVVAQGILESAAGTSNFAKQRNNFFGIGAFDSDPNKAFSYSTPEDGWRGYYENIRKTATYRNHGVFVGDTITDPHAYARAIKAAGYASDPNYVSKLDTLIKAIENRANEKGWDSSAQLAAKNPEMLSNAAANASGDGDSGKNISVSDVDYTMCDFSAGGDGNINATAINLSWADRTHAPTDPKPVYADALISTGVNKLGDTCSMGGYSCDAFLATVMRYSGADSGFPCCGAANQLQYLSSHGELYEEIPNIGNTSNLQPGDIRASGGHVEIVVQLEDGSYKIASASHCDRTADHAINYYESAKFRIFRKK